jgi:predicted ribosomally synthesized peptide with nif11-like leader
MSQEAATAFLDRVESDDDFAKELESLRENHDAVYLKVKEAGFDAKPEEIREAFLERYGAELTPEQLEQVAAGVDAVTVVAGITGVAVLAGMAAIAAGI